jgi:hypothetical protein
MNIYNTEIKLYEEKDKDPIHHLLKENYCICCDRKELKECLYSEKVLEQYNKDLEVYESELKNYLEKYF